MELDLKKVPRKFTVGKAKEIIINDLGSLKLDPNEQITFLNSDGKREYDFCRKEWGFYATPSMNDRLKRFGYKSALVRNESGQLYLMIVEEDKLELFSNYLEGERSQVVAWIDEHAKDQCFQYSTLKLHEYHEVCLCGCSEFRVIHLYETPPEDEIKLNLENYRRVLKQCIHCNHYISEHDYDLEMLYKDAYVSSTYGDKLKETFARIMQLPSNKSDNNFRVQRIIDNVEQKGSINMLDVGSGLAVFPYAISQKTNWKCTAIDPDKRQVQHALDLGLNAIHADFLEFNPVEKYDLVTFNKVLEHVKDPIGFLTKTASMLNNNGMVYIELPDGEAAIQDSPLREEFLIDHYYAFSMQSMAVLAQRAGFTPLKICRIVEPSSKYTLYMFCRKQGI